MHQIHNSEAGYAWQIRGKDHTKILFSNTGRTRINITGAYNPITYIPTIQIEEANCTIDSTKRFFDLLRTTYTDMTLPIILILDNARYQKAYEVQAYAKIKNIQLEYLPAYSPNLNLIERFWKYTKNILIKNQYYETYTEFREAFVDFFSLMNQPNNQHTTFLKTLLTMNFDIISKY